MDKSKNRTDLLAAGRKKLQQYRQKKDNKGTSSHAKSSKKSGKSEKHEGDDATASSADKTTKSLPVPEGELAPSADSDPGISASSMSHPIKNSETREVDVATVNQLPVATNEPEPNELGFGEQNADFFPSNDAESRQAVDVGRVTSLETSEPNSEGEITSTDISIPNSEGEITHTETSEEPNSEGASAMTNTNTVYKGEEESIPSQEDIPDVSLIQAREDQEADSSGLEQPVRSIETGLKRDGTCQLPELNYNHETVMEAAFEGTNSEQGTHEGNQTLEVDDGSTSGGTTNVADDFSASDLAVPEAVQVLNSEDIVVGLSNEEKVKVQTMSSYNENEKKNDVQADTEHGPIADMHDQQYLPERSFIHEGKNHEGPFEPKTTISSGGFDDSPVTDVSSISMSQIVQMIRGLGENEFRLLLKLRESDANSEFGSGSLARPEHGLQDFSDRFKQELFLSNISKDIFQLQLTEQSELQMEFDEKRDQLVDEISVLRASLDEVRGRNYSLSEELAQCRSDLQVVASGREELQNQLCTTEAKVQEFSDRACELQNSLERSLEDLSSLSKELADCKGLVGILQAENDNINKTLASVTEDARKLEEQKEHYLHENEKLLTELAECKNLVTAVQAENFNLIGSLSSVTDQRNKLEEEKECIFQEKEKVSGELADLKVSLETLQVEVASIDGNLAVATEERKKLEEDNLSIMHENEKLSSEEVLVSTLQVENDSINKTLASVTEDTRKLEEQKEHYLNEIEKLLTELAEYKNLVAAVQAENSNLSGSLASVTDEKNKLEEAKECIVQEKEKVSVELANLKVLLEALQAEVASIDGSLALVAEERKKLEEDKLSFVHENEKLSSEKLVIQEQLITGQKNTAQVEDDLKQANMRNEELIEENLSLSSSLDMHKAKIIELADRQIQIPIQAEEERNQVEPSKEQGGGHEIAIHGEDSQQIYGRQDGEVPSPVLEKTLIMDASVGVPPVKLPLLEVFDDSYGLSVLKGHLKEAEETLEKLEKEIEGTHSHLSALSKSASKVSKPVVSKLIQAFESKVHQEEIEVEKAVTAYQSSANQFLLTRELTGNLRAVLKQLELDAENASILLKGERDGTEDASIMFRELKVQHESLKEHCDNMEATNIELGVLYEAAKQHVCEVQRKNSELEVMYESLQQKDVSLKAENSELVKKLAEYQSKLSRLENQFHDLQKSSYEVASTIQNQLESVQNEANERATTLEQKWSYIVSLIVEKIGKLGVTVETFSNYSVGSEDELEINSFVSASVDAAIEVIEDLREKLKAVHTNYEAMSNSFKEVNEKLNGLCGEKEMAVGVLRKIHGDLCKLVIDSRGSAEESEMNMQNLEQLDPLDPINYETLMQQLRKFLGEKLQLESVNNKLNAELTSRTKDIEELHRRCLDSNVIDKLVGDVEGVVKLKDAHADSDKPPILRLESLISFLVEKYNETDEQVSLSREEFASRMMEITELQEMIQQLNTINLQHVNEILTLKESLSQAEEAVLSTQSQLQDKASELEQSEQRVSSIREKLSIAVAKGKGLIVQRDSLKQSLAEKSSELERCSQELQLKETRLLEVESKLKTYAEAGERVEALESELSYIRNSATALRESFLHKDSILQRIEEILEDLDLPEHFHSRDIIEKVDWLARSAAGNSAPVSEWDQKSSGGGGSYLDSGFVVMDAWKEDVQPNLNAGDDLKRKYEELQSKFFGLAEQNEMLEQSLMERNYLVQRWEELLDKINMPSHLRSVEPEDRIEWLGSALSEALHEGSSLQQKIDELESYYGSLTADLEDSRSKITDLVTDLQAVVTERNNLSERLESLNYSHENLSAKAVQLELDNEKLQNEVAVLQENVAEKLENEKATKHIEDEIRRMQELVSDALKDPGTADLASGGSGTECLEALLRKLLESYSILSEVKPVPENVGNYSGKEGEALYDVSARDTLDTEETEATNLKKELEAALLELMHVKEERDRHLEKQQSLGYEVEALNRKTKELQELVSQEEQKSASVREKLNVAVRKGKSLVQQRDSLKQTIEELNSVIESLKSEINHRGNVLVEYEQKIRDLSTYQERVEALESESLFLKNRLRETEYYLQEKGGTLSMILNTLGEVDVGGEVNMNDPIKKLEHIINVCRDLHEAVASSEQQSQKSKRAAELLLAELNEVQERNDGLQEDLAKASIELGELLKERDVAESARTEALLRIEKLSATHSQERQNLMGLKSGVEKLRKGFFDLNVVLADIFSKDLELLRNLEAGLESCLNLSDASEMTSLPVLSVGGFISSNLNAKDFMSDISMQDYFEHNAVTEVCSFIQHHLQGFVTDIGSLKETIQKHSISLHDQNSQLSNKLGNVHREMITRRNSLDSMKKDIIDMESIVKEKEKENIVLRKNIATLFEVCTGSIIEVENRKAELVGSTVGDIGIGIESVSISDGPSYGGKSLFSEDCIKTLADRLLSAVKDFASMKGDIVDSSLKEMKTTVAKLQKEIQEKDMQKDRISMELVGQIKVAEASAASYSLELQSSKTQVNNMEKQLKEMEEERNLLHQRMMELQDGQASSVELQEKLTSLTDVLAAKDQEIEALMQALEEEEVQMEDMRKKIEELEKVMQQKNLDLENLEASRGKLMKKHSITVSKFDELHYLSANLIAEVEKLHSQIQERDAEISFLRQEVTRCTNDVLVATQMSNKNSDEIHGLLTWFDTVISGVVDLDEKKTSDHDYKEILQEKILSVISELKDLRVESHTRDTSLRVERSQIEELTRKQEALEKSLQEKEFQLNLLESAGDSGQASTRTSEISEVEPLMNKRAVTGAFIAPQVRGSRKVNNDQVAIAIDMDPGSSSRLEDEDDDKVHGFKSLTTSRIIPRFTRPVTDLIDGVWVSCDRTLMRQPTFRLGIILYWFVMHALVATFVV